MTEKVLQQKRASIMDEIYTLLTHISELEINPTPSRFADKVPQVRKALAAKYEELTSFDAQSA
jgi:hypothetical protein